MQFFEISTVLSTFVAVFLAEMGDKTQLTTFANSAATNNRISVFLGASCALLLSTILSVILGQIVGNYVSARMIEGAAGVFFIFMGCQMLYKFFS